MKDRDEISKRDIRNNIEMIKFCKMHSKQAHTLILR
jgi:hypothetical protein